MRTISVQIRTSCSKCGSTIPLNALVPRLACAACSQQNELGEAFWASILGDTDLSTCTIYTEGREVALEVGKAGPACGTCGADISAKAALASADAGSIACEKCGARTLLRVPPPAFVTSGFQLLIGEDELQVPAAGVTVAPSRGVAQPVAFNCPTCGGVLQADGSARIIQCAYCQGAAYMPDELWHVFHPVPRTRTWYLVKERGARRRARADAENPGTTPERLEALSHHLNADVREAVARHPHTPEDTLRRLALQDESLAAEVLENPSISAATWPALVSTGSSWILERIAGRANAPPQVLRTVMQAVADRLSDDFEGDAETFDLSDVDDIFEALAENPATPADVLAQVARLNESRVPSERGDHDERLAKHPNAPAALLAELARSEDASAREAVAQHRHTSAEVLESLAADPEADVRAEVAKRPELSPETLKRLGRDEEYGVRQAARANPAYPRFNLLTKLFGG
jgi:DNA-directed RNA polymerase subunit RPC12/RpoP